MQRDRDNKRGGRQAATKVKVQKMAKKAPAKKPGSARKPATKRTKKLDPESVLEHVR
eukprot:SAG11_NODE_1923_length_4060_cov_4.514012_1_plen_57_part_00